MWGADPDTGTVDLNSLGMRGSGPARVPRRRRAQFLYLVGVVPCILDLFYFMYLTYMYSI